VRRGPRESLGHFIGHDRDDTREEIGESGREVARGEQVLGDLKLVQGPPAMS
jgi:hypothetical protein